MRKLSVFNFSTLNGFFEGASKGDISWHVHGEEEGRYSEAMLAEGGTLVFGRVTYEMMARFWPTPMALKTAPVVANGMNSAEKIVFSTTMKRAEWQNTTLIKGNLTEEIRKLKQSRGKDMAVLGSGTIVTQLAEAGLVDAYEIMIDPVLIGSGTPMFNGLKSRINLKFISSRTFPSGVILLKYVMAE